MKFFKKALIASAVTAASFGALSTASAATLQTDVDINFPTIIVLYAFDSIELNIADSFAQSLFGTPVCTGTSPANLECGVEVDTGAPRVFNNVDGASTIDLDIASDSETDAISPTTQTFTLENVFGARSLGVAQTTYTTTVTNTSADTGVTVGTVAALPNTGFALSVGDIPLTVDFADPDVADGTASAILNIVVTGT